MAKLLPKWSKLQKEDRLYNLELPLIGLTGGIATGKSQVTRLLKQDGINVIDADQLIKTAYKDEEILTLLKAEAPKVVHDNNQIAFNDLRRLFFEKSDLKQKLENALYSKLPELFKKEVSKIQNQNFIVYDIPLLFEKNLESKFDLKVVVYANKEQQFQRVKSRDKSSDEVIQNILKAQMDINLKKEKADYIIENTGSPQDLVTAYNLFKKNVFTL
jgi:dephospho-CoA kinase